MYYILFYETVDNYTEKRIPYRAEHLALAQEAQTNGTLILAGAFAKPADGAALIFKATSSEVAENFAANDPYVKNGLVTHGYVREWTVVIGGD